MTLVKAPAKNSPVLRRERKIAQLLRFVHDGGLSVEEAARKVRAEPALARIWLDLPSGIWRTRTGLVNASLICRIPDPALKALKAMEKALAETVVAALLVGLSLPLPKTPGETRFAGRVVSVTIPASVYNQVLEVAHRWFGGDPRRAAGWLIAFGMGTEIPSPPPPAPPVVKQPLVILPAQRPPSRPAPGPKPSEPLPADNLAPSGDDLRARRDALGISQRELAKEASLPPSAIGGVESGKRQTPSVRRRMDETLASLEAKRPAPVVQEEDGGDYSPEKFRALRRQAGLSQGRVGRGAGVDSSSIGNFELGKLRPSRAFVRKIFAVVKEAIKEQDTG